MTKNAISFLVLCAAAAARESAVQAPWPGEPDAKATLPGLDPAAGRRERSLEQTFVFDELPARGEIRLVVRTSTDLVGEDLGDGVAFRGEHLQVGYSEAVAIDASATGPRRPTTYCSPPDVAKPGAFRSANAPACGRCVGASCQPGE